jgi:Icc-related predicted phosphoesterase
MLIGLISDTHNKHKQLVIPNDIDLLIHAGDITIHGNEGELSSFNEWCGTLHLPKEKIIVVAGNHDQCIQHHGKRWAKETLSNCTYLEDEEYVVDGLKIYGTPWSPTFGLWAFMVDRHTDRMMRLRQAIPEGMDIVICHSPPNGVLDNIPGNLEKPGCNDLRNALILKKPKYFVCGHIHSGRGEAEFEGIKCYNGSVLTNEYSLVTESIITFKV